MIELHVWHVTFIPWAIIAYMMWDDDNVYAYKPAAVITACVATATILAARFLP